MHMARRNTFRRIGIKHFTNVLGSSNLDDQVLIFSFPLLPDLFIQRGLLRTYSTSMPSIRALGNYASRKEYAVWCPPSAMVLALLMVGRAIKALFSKATTRRHPILSLLNAPLNPRCHSPARRSFTYCQLISECNIRQCRSPHGTLL